MGKMPWTRSRSNGSRLQTGLIPRRRSRRLRKRVHFKKEECSKASFPFKCPAARSLFLFKTISELPNEVTTRILSYFNATELMTLRCVDHHFKGLVDGNLSLWSNVSYHNMWPTTVAEFALFQRGAKAGNVESFTKLGLSHLYHYNLTVGAEKNKKDVEIHSVQAARYLHNLDVNIHPKKPLTWVLIRPPWSQSRSICLKHLVHTQMLELQKKNPDSTVYYNLGRVFNLESNDTNNKQKVAEQYLSSSKMGNQCATLELLLSQKSCIASDAGKTLKWLRDLNECAMSGNLEAKFELVHWTVLHGTNGYSNFGTEQLSQELFQSCSSSHIDKLEQYQPKINTLMRCILIDWLAEVTYIKDMSPQVLHAAVAYVDRYLMSRLVERIKLQLLGITCLLLASKSHHDTRMVHLLTVRESSWLTDQTYQYEDVVRMMGEIIGAFKGDLWRPTSWNFLDILLLKVDDVWKCLSHYLHDMSLQFTSFGSYKPSTLACSTVFLAGIILNRDDPWPKEFIDVSGFNIKDIVNCAALIHYKCFTGPSIKDDRNIPLESIKFQYGSQLKHFVSKMDILSEVEIKTRILLAESCLTCMSQEPLHFEVVTTQEIDETFNMSIKSVDYDGDSEDSLNSDSELDESFCVGRSRLSSYHSVEEFSDDETTMDAESLHFNGVESASGPRESFTPIFPLGNNGNAANCNKYDGASSFNGQYLNHYQFFGPTNDNLKERENNPEGGPSGVDRGKRIVRNKTKSIRYHPVGKRTRSQSSKS